MKILLAGSEGFIGKAFLDNLSKDFEIICTGRNLTKENKTHIKIDLVLDDLNKLPEDIDIIVNLASQQPSGINVSWDDLYKGNVISTLKLWDYAREISAKKFIYISSTSLFNQSSPSNKLRHDSVALPLTEYGLTKYISEILLKMRSEDENIKTIILRFPSVFGDGHKGGLVKTFYDLALENKTIDVFNNGKIYRNLLFKSDAVSAIKKCIENETLENFEIFMIGSSDSLRSKEIAKKIIKLTKSKSRINLVSKPSPVDSDIFLDLEKSINKLNFKPSSIEHGLKCFIEGMNNEI
ncbi:MAG: NAD(P)-dependent oxidoreductase [Flavobacteriales bacterium]